MKENLHPGVFALILGLLITSCVSSKRLTVSEANAANLQKQTALHKVS